MSTQIVFDNRALARVCERFDVERLRVFGSALTDHFDPKRSDVDLLVDYLPTAKRTFRDFFALRDELEDVIGYRVDLIEPKNLRNPYVAQTVFAATRDLYAA